MDLSVEIAGFCPVNWERYAWIKLPISLEEIEEQTGLGLPGPELKIVNHTFPFKLKDFLRVEELNHLANRLNEFKENDPRIRHLSAIADKWFGGNVRQALDELNQIRYYKEASNYAELAGQLIKAFKTGTYIAKDLREFFDVNAYASWLEKKDGYLFADGVGFVHRAKNQSE